MAARASTDVVGPTRGAERFEGVERWSAHPQLARLVRVFVYGIPLILAVASGWLVGKRLTLAQPWPAVWRWMVMSAVATGVLVVVERVGRRLLPLSTLLDLSLVFPDRAPSRFAVALRAGSVSQLEPRVAPSADGTVETDSADAAAKILGHVFALHRHDRRTRGHSERVRAFAVLIGNELGLRADQIDKLQWAALLHDVGKLGVPSSILNKDGRPTEQEWSTLAGHPAHGELLIAPLAAWLGEWAGAVTEHHERWDGDGYPGGLRGDEISLAGRIVAVADSFEVMTAARSYKKPLSIAAARTELTSCAGAQFDPAIVRAFLNVSIGRLRRVLSPVAWVTQLPFIPPAAALPAPSAIAATGALVGGLLLGPAVMPTFGGQAAGAPEVVAAETSPAFTEPQPLTPPANGRIQTSAEGATTGGSAPTSTPGEPIRAAGPTAREPSDNGRVPTTSGSAETPAPGSGRVVDSVVAPVAGSLVTPIVNSVVIRVVHSVVIPLVDSVVTPVVDSVVTPVVGSVVTPLVQPLVP